MSFCVGLDAVLKWGAAGSTAASTLNNVQDVSVTGDRDTIERIRRGIRWKGKKTTTKTLSLDVTLLYDPTDAGFQAIRQRFMSSDAAIALAILDDQGHGFDADFEITKFGREEPVEGDLTVPVTFELNTDSRNPSWVGG